MYKQLKNFGATGGKIIGAGGGCFCVIAEKKIITFQKKIQKLKITNIPFSLFDNNEECTKIFYLEFKKFD